MEEEECPWFFLAFIAIVYFTWGLDGEEKD